MCSSMIPLCRRCLSNTGDVTRLVSHSLDVHEAGGLDNLRKEVAQGDVLGALVEPKFVAKAERRCAVCKDVNW